MAKIKFDVDIQKIAVVPTNQGPAKIGTIEFEDKKDGMISYLIDIDNTVPQNILDAIQKNPELIDIVEQHSQPKNFVLIAGIIQ